MKTKKEALDVDYIGAQDASMTPEEESALRDFFAQKRSASATRENKKRKGTAKRINSPA